MPDRILGGRYALTALLGRGGMGEVWVAHDLRIGRDVAVKTLQGHAPSRTDVDRFLREAQTAGRLNHPNIVTVHDVAEDDDGTLYIVMELLTGQDLATVVRTGPPTGPPAPVVLAWCAQILAGLTAAHDAGVFHHDLKPANTQLTTSGVVKILDFGIARYASATTKASSVVGTVAYMAPERLQGCVGDARSDLYSLGCMLVELLTGGPPFTGDNPAAVMMAHLTEPYYAAALDRPHIPPQLRSLILELLAKDPDARPASARVVQRRLETIGATSQPPSWQSSAPQQSVLQPPIPGPAPVVGFNPAITLQPPALPALPAPTTRRTSARTKTVLALGAVLLVGGATTAIVLSLPGTSTPNTRGASAQNPPGTPSSNPTTTPAQNATHPPDPNAVKSSDIAAKCEEMYLHNGQYSLTTGQCQQIAACYEPKLQSLTFARYTAVYEYNLDSEKPAPPDADRALIQSAKAQCATALPDLVAYVDGTVGET